MAATKGAPQGAVLSPLLANIYLHYVLDLWARQWRERHARGDVIVVRYADDCVVGFRTKVQAQQFLAQLQERLARFGLSLNASKTRLIDLDRFAVINRRKLGLGKPETFDFLGITQFCSVSRRSDFQVLRLTVKKRMRATLLAIRDELKRRRHEPIRVQGQWLLQLPRRARKLKATEWLQESHMPILASGSRAAQPAKSPAMVSLWVADQPLHTRPKECTSLP